MGFLAPAFLLGALSLGLPLYLHLLKRRASSTQPFSSLLLFEPQQPSLVRRRRLRHLLLLALRLAVFALLALAFAQPFYGRIPAGADAGRHHVLVIDDSLSMRAGTRLADAQKAALAVLDSRRLGEHAEVWALGDSARMLAQPTADTQSLRAAIEHLAPGDGRSHFALLSGLMRSIAQNTATPIALHVFSDMQKSGMPADFAELQLPSRVELHLHPVGHAEANWTVQSVTAPAELADVRHARVHALICGYGTSAATRQASLSVNGRAAGTHAVTVPACGCSSVEFELPELAHGFNRGAVRIDAADALRADDEFDFTVERTEPRHGLFIHQGADDRSALYFGSAVTSAFGSAMTLESVTPQHPPADLSGYAFVVLSDIAAPAAALESRLQNYVRAGGSVLVALGTTAAQTHTVPLLSALKLSPHYYSRTAERYASVAEADENDPVAGTAREWNGVKFFFVAAAEPADARVSLRLTDRTPLLLQKSLGDGSVLLYTSSFDNLTSDLPLRGEFVAFVDRLVRTMSGSEKHAASLAVGERVSLRAARDPAGRVDVIDPDGAHPISLQDSATASSWQLERAGFYTLRRASGQIQVVAANADRRESDLTPLAPEDLALWRGSPAGESGSAGASGAGTAQPRALQPRSVWWYAMAMLLVAVLAEAVLASGYLGTLRDEL
ncbi:MAG TPA: BatA domain-containing protein [Steroidobacteraceae bacterium]|nr:BatA domain-containing protein [Steroidobacteraceae bacterium]